MQSAAYCSVLTYFSTKWDDINIIVFFLFLPESACLIVYSFSICMMVQYGSTALFLNYITDSDRPHPVTGIQWHSRTILDSYRRQKAGHVAANMNILTVAQ